MPHTGGGKSEVYLWYYRNMADEINIITNDQIALLTSDQIQTTEGEIGSGTIVVHPVEAPQELPPINTSEPVIVPSIVAEDVLTEDKPELEQVKPVEAPAELPPTISTSTPTPSPVLDTKEIPTLTPTPDIKEAPHVGDENPNIQTAPILAPLSKMDLMFEKFKANINRAKELLVKARLAKSAQKRKKIEKVMTLFLKKKKIKNDDVEKFLRTSDSNAGRYLTILVNEKKIIRHGLHSPETYYTKAE